MIDFSKLEAGQKLYFINRLMVDSCEVLHPTIYMSTALYYEPPKQRNILESKNPYWGESVFWGSIQAVFKTKDNFCKYVTLREAEDYFTSEEDCRKYLDELVKRVTKES